MCATAYTRESRVLRTYSSEAGPGYSNAASYRASIDMLRFGFSLTCV